MPPGRQLDAKGVSIDDAPIAMLRHKSDRREALKGFTDWDNASIVEHSLIINKPRDELYAFFRNFQNLPRFMENVQRIDVHDETHSHWVVEAPGATTVEWNSSITIDEVGARIGWMSEAGADVRNEGQITFCDSTNGRGTIVSALILFDAPAGGVGRFLATAAQKDPGVQTRRELRRFKQLMETGEIATAEAQRAAPRGH